MKDKESLRSEGERENELCIEETMTDEKKGVCQVREIRVLRVDGGKK